MKFLRRARAAARRTPSHQEKHQFQSRLQSSLRLKRLQTEKNRMTIPKTNYTTFLLFSAFYCNASAAIFIEEILFRGDFGQNFPRASVESARVFCYHNP